VSPAGAKISDGIVDDGLSEARRTNCSHCLTQGAIGHFAVHSFLWELLRAEIALLLVNVIVDDARIRNVVIIWREPPPDRSRDRSQVSQEIPWYFDNPAEEGALVLKRGNEFKIGCVGVSGRGDGLLAAQAPEIQFTQELIAHASERETILPAAQDD
jgi:hypothetical protein